MKRYNYYSESSSSSSRSTSLRWYQFQHHLEDRKIQCLQSKETSVSHTVVPSTVVLSLTLILTESATFFLLTSWDEKWNGGKGKERKSGTYLPVRLSDLYTAKMCVNAPVCLHAWFEEVSRRVSFGLVQVEEEEVEVKADDNVCCQIISKPGWFAHTQTSQTMTMMMMTMTMMTMSTGSGHCKQEQTN